MSAPKGVPAPRRRERIGIRDVAAAAGVSVTTVSDALNGKGRLPESTRGHVREVADRLGYRPSAAARTLRTGRSGLIGLTTSSRVAEPFALTEFAWFAELVRAATATALDRGYGLVVLPASSRHDVWNSIPLDGAIVVDPAEDDPLVRDLDRRGVPVVGGGRPMCPSVQGWVDIDHDTAMGVVLGHLVEAGARRVAVVSADEGSYARRSRAAHERWCARTGHEPVWVTYAAPTFPAGQDAIGALLDGPAPPDAIYGIHETCGSDVLAAARARGLGVPGDLLVASCGEESIYGRTEPPVTTLSLGPRAIGASTVEMLVGIIEDGGPFAGRTVPVRLCPRASTTRGPAA